MNELAKSLELIAQPGFGERPVFDRIAELQAEIDRLRMRLTAILEWHQNWDAPFHDEDEWIEDYRLAREALGYEPAPPALKVEEGT